MTRDDARDIYLTLIALAPSLRTDEEMAEALIDADVALGFYKLEDEADDEPNGGDVLVKLMGRRLAYRLLAQLESAGFKIMPKGTA